MGFQPNLKNTSWQLHSDYMDYLCTPLPYTEGTDMVYDKLLATGTYDNGNSFSLDSSTGGRSMEIAHLSYDSSVSFFTSSGLSSYDFSSNVWIGEPIHYINVNGSNYVEDEQLNQLNFNEWFARNALPVNGTLAWSGNLCNNRYLYGNTTPIAAHVYDVSNSEISIAASGLFGVSEPDTSSVEMLTSVSTVTYTASAKASCLYQVTGTSISKVQLVMYNPQAQYNGSGDKYHIIKTIATNVIGDGTKQSYTGTLSSSEINDALTQKSLGFNCFGILYETGTSDSTLYFYPSEFTVTVTSPQPTGVNTNILVNGSWKQGKDMYVNINNTWKHAKDCYMMVNNSWKRIFQPTPSIPDYLCFTANAASSTVLLHCVGTPTQNQSFEYSTNATNWSTYVLGTTLTLTNIGDTLYFRGNNTAIGESTSVYFNFDMTGNIAASGNVMSLVDITCTSLTIPSNYCFYNLFRDCFCMTTPPKLPATTLKTGCYRGIFRDCDMLTSVPQLPATVIPNYAYRDIFRGCYSLKIYSSSGSGHTCAYTIPTSGTVSGTTSHSTMFLQTEGDYGSTETITLPITVYTQNDPI